MITDTEEDVVFPWRKEYSVDMPQIDGQHKILVGLINDLQSAMMEGRGKWALADILDELIRYTRSHFAFEEDMLQKQGYSQLPAHHAVHEGLTAQVCELRDRFQSGKLAISMEVLRFLKDWLADHILRHDKDYAKELSGK